MGFVVLLLVLAAIGWAVWWRHSHQRQDSAPTPPASAGVLARLVDQGRDLLAPLFPSKPLSRRALPRRLLRAAEQTITVGVSGMVLVPTRIQIAVNPADLDPFTDAMEWLRRDVREALRQKADANGWVVPSGPEVVIVADDERPVRLPRAVGRIDAFRPDDVATRRRVGSPQELPHARTPAPAHEATSMTEAAPVPDDGSLTTAPADVTIHLRLVSTEPRTDGRGDLNALLVASDTPLVMGRSREADLQVNDRQVSARHCTLSIDAERHDVVVHDLGSTNGSFVDGQRIEEATLQPGSTFRIGTTSWQVEYRQTNV